MSEGENMAAGKLPNIIVCICDQLRAFETGCYGNPVVRTPNIDRLASEGARFETAVTNFPVCMAARSVLISGQYNRSCTGGVSNVTYPGRPGDHNMPEYPEAGRPHLKDTTLPEILRSAGYHTAIIGKWHIHSWPNDVGFDYYLIPRVHHCHSGQSFTENGGPEFVPPGYSVDFEAERVEEFIRRRRGSREPFFLYYSISPPHCPLADAPDRFLAMYRPADVPLRPNVRPDVRLDNEDYHFKVYRWDFRYYNLRLPYTEKLPEGYDIRRLIAEYYGLTTWMDEAVGRMLRAMRENGLEDNTILAFTSDHGDNLGSHGLVQKGRTNEESIRIPLIVRWPRRIRAGAVIRSHVGSLVDLAPTLAAMAGISVPAHWEGRDLSPLLFGDDAVGAVTADNCAFIETKGSIAIRSPRYIYELPLAGRGVPPGDRPTRFFDLADDPWEMRNLAPEGGVASEADAAELDRLLREWDARTPWMK